MGYFVCTNVFCMFLFLIFIDLAKGICFETFCSSFSPKCCNDGSCCTVLEYNAENIVDAVVPDISICSEFACRVVNSQNTKCCNDGECCSEFQYNAENAVDGVLGLGIGPIVAISVGGFLFIVFFVVACVCCFCRPGQTRQGTVITTTNAVQPAVPINQYQLPATQQYPPTGYPPMGNQYDKQYNGLA